MNDKLLILDLDETLIHASSAALERAPDFMVDDFHVYARPRAHEFVSFCRLHFRVAVWTSASESYARAITDHLLGSDYPLEFLWTRERCTAVYDPGSQTREWVKDLKKVRRRGYSLDRVLMVDDTPTNLVRNYGNLIRIRAFEGDARDVELQLLMPYLLQLRAVSDVRSVDKRLWRAEEVKSEPSAAVGDGRG